MAAEGVAVVQRHFAHRCGVSDPPATEQLPTKLPWPAYDQAFVYRAYLYPHLPGAARLPGGRAQGAMHVHFGAELAEQHVAQP